MKKLFSMLLMLCLLCPSLSALAEVTVSAPGELPIVSAPVTLTAWAAQGAIIEDMATNKTTQWAEEQTGVHIEWIMVNGAEASTQLNLSLAGGDYPDLYLTTFTTDMVQLYAQYGVFIPLNDLIEKHGFHTKAAFVEHPEFQSYFTAPDGNIYTSIYTDPGEHLLSQNKLFVNTDFLKTAGLGVPQTTAAFRDMLIAFRDQDVNGNGDPSDEIPLMGALGDVNEPVGFLMNPFQLYTPDYLLAQDEKVTFIANTDGWRKGLQYMHDLYADGLLAEETFVQTPVQLKSLVSVAEPENRIVGAYSGMWQGAAVNTGVIANGYDLYAPVTPLEGPSGLRQTATSGFGRVDMRGVITSACKEPAVAMKWLDFWLGEEATVVVDYGFVGSEYEWSDIPAISGVVPSRLRTASDKWSTVQNDIYDLNVVPHYRTSEILYSRTPTDHVPYLYAAAQAYAPYYVITGFPAFIWSTDTESIHQSSELAALINDYVATSYTQFILGVTDIYDDASWQQYVDALDTMDLARYLALKQQMTFGK
ncbi:MAG: extracellular solute-binding protein [Clostridia bacterium]